MREYTIVKCEVCGKDVKNLGAHTRKAHPSSVVGNSSSAPPTPVMESAPTKVESNVQRYLSVRSPGLTIIIEPERQGFINTPSGSMHTTLPGKRVHFFNGMLETSDPVIIDFLDNQYKDRRFPVTNMTKVEAKVKGV